MTGIIYSILITIMAGSIIPFNEKNAIAKLSLFYLAGTVILSLYMLILSLLGIPYSILSISLPFILYFLLTLRRWKEIRPEQIHFEWKFTLLLLLFAFVLLAMISTCITLPVFRADALGGWVFRAKVFFFERRIALEVFRDKIFCQTADYPLLVSLNLTWISICLGKWNDMAIKLFFAFQWTAAASLFYSSLKNIMGKVIALSATLIAFTLPVLLTNLDIAYVDASLSFYVLASAVFLYRWLGSGNLSDLLVSAFFIGASAWTKNDGIGLVLAMLATLALMKVSPRDILAYAATSFMIFVPYKLMTMFYALGSHMQPERIIINNLSRIPTILYWFFHEFILNTYYWQYFWVIMFALLIIFRSKIQSSKLKHLLTFCFLSMLIYALIYLIVPEKVYLFLDGTIDRLLLGLAPTIAFSVFAVAFGEERPL